MTDTTAIQPPIQNAQPSKTLNTAFSNASQRAIKKIVFSLVDEAIKYNFACIMIRPKYIAEIFKIIK